ncbi:MAG: hypothetical protein JO186_08610 [Actinobacteria bacterium]|nr:hypothetical protein [Actinomycetota bacterium]MBV8396176.1 hypothetical protein [Actinomycetota bacterium]
MFRATGFVLVVAAALAAAASGSRGSATVCPTDGLSAGGAAKVVKLTAEGVGCTKARAIARRVAQQVGAGKPVDAAGAQGLSYNVVASCSPQCTSMTQVALTYPNGTVTITLGHTLKTTPSPAPAPVPAPAPGPGTVI